MKNVVISALSFLLLINCFSILSHNNLPTTKSMNTDKPCGVNCWSLDE